MNGFSRITSFTATLAVVLIPGCRDSAGPVHAAEIELRLDNLRPLDLQQEGSYEAWVLDGERQAHSAGRFDLPGSGIVTVASPIETPAQILVTVEPPGDTDPGMSDQRLLGGPVQGTTAELDVISELTIGLPLIEEPGTHVLFTPSDNAELGYPSYEDAGLWLFTFGEDSANAGFYLNLTPLWDGWVYEGWIVYDYGTAGDVWISYGKFLADDTQRARGRDDTGAGPLSGQLEYEDALPIEVIMPGDDWVANPHGFDVPGGLDLPFDLNGCTRSPEYCALVGTEYGPSHWTHVITIEPAFDRGEPILTEKPFLIQPYRNPIGEGTPEVERVVEFHPEMVPRGVATLIPVGGS